jgi:hypothetical protein
MTQPIPQPELLDPDRINRDAREHFTTDDHRARADLLSQALEDSCAYARQLWETLDAQRSYLLQSLPPDPRTPGTHVLGASPTGPDDELGWRNWIGAFAAATSALCGSHGDSGFGLSEARAQAQLRRDAPEMQLLAHHPELQHGKPEPDSTDTSPPAQPAPAPKKSAATKLVAGVLIGALALRGLRPRTRLTR